MKAFSKAHKSNAVFVVALAIMMLAGSISAFAVPPGQVARVYNAVTFTGQCCYLWNEEVQVTEPAKLVPVIVTWSADLIANDQFLVGLSLNGSGCTAYGSRELASYELFGYRGVNATHQWIVFPSDGLVKGTNTFALCGGGASSPSDTISFGLSTLVVQISK